MIRNHEELKKVVEREVNNVKITDIHTHIYSKDFNKLLLWGIDELLTYHYLIAEFFRYSNMDYDKFFKMSKKEQAELVWKTLFIENTPISEAQRGVLTILNKLGLDTANKDLEYYRNYFKNISLEEYIDKVFEVSNVKCVVMTNDPFDDDERPVWEKDGNKDERFKAALRIDALLMNYPKAMEKMIKMGYDVSLNLNEKTICEIKRFLDDWAERMGALYMAASLPPSFNVPEDSARWTILDRCILKVCKERNMPFALMIGVNKNVNYELGLAGDSVGRANNSALEYLCRNYPENKFMITYLSRENQHEVLVTARKFKNLFVFGCWWFLNNPVLIEEMTRMRFELLGLSFMPQHSDARVLDQLIYKWEHSRKIISKVLFDKYSDIFDTGFAISEEDVRRDVENIFGNNFFKFLNA
ncbi:hypothetical protein SAMN05443428_11553 [Caloramator quimbayensis]|uniref:Glucuronate isomerase n=1 Tax=Caloramator quimbayensis TaxID=1147123 RepID=A0A1T4XXG4_9CLOT|nr:glucuronate isomerase [Caloramator quimbayensis]SKA94093.1 hypothetical protein SAMN05443428_11553 [Caloramator quimbayensis]